MRRVAFAIAGLVIAGAGPALAQYGYPPRPMMSVGPMPPEGVFEMVRQMGLEPIGRPLRNGPVWIQRAADYYGKPLRVMVDASRGQVVSVEPVGGPPMLHGGPYASTGAPYLRRPYGPYRVMAPDDDDDYAPPGSVMAPHAYPRAGVQQPNMPACRRKRSRRKSQRRSPRPLRRRIRRRRASGLHRRHRKPRVRSNRFSLHHRKRLLLLPLRRPPSLQRRK